MELSLSIDYDGEEADAEERAALERIIAEEAREFAEAICRRLEAEGARDIKMSLSERPD